MKYLVFFAITKVLIFWELPKCSLAFFLSETTLLNQMLKLSSGLLDEAQSRIQRRSSSLRETQEQGIQSQELTNRRNREDEAALEKLAKEQGQWLDNADEELESQYGEMIGHGAESYVYQKDANTVVKSRTIDPNVEGGYKTYQEALESIAIHNRLFPETAMKIVGFGKSDGEFCVIIEQPRINGRFATTEEIQQFLTDRFGEETVKIENILGGHSYKNPVHLLQDIKPKNVIVKDIDGKEQLFVIDGDFYNTEEYQNHLNTQQSSQPTDRQSPAGELRQLREQAGSNPSSINADETETFTTPEGEVYGFVDKDGNIYLDETVITPEHPIHEYTHVWDRIVAKKNPRLWKRGVQLMKQSSLWDEVIRGYWFEIVHPLASFLCVGDFPACALANIAIHIDDKDFVGEVNLA